MNAPEMNSAQAVGAALGAESIQNATAVQIVPTPAGPVQILLPDLAGIPEEVKALRCAVWKAEPELDAQGNAVRKPNGKPYIKKAPRSPARSYISKTKPEQWASFDDCSAALARGEFSGVGVLMQAESGLVGIDLDNVPELVREKPAVKLLMAQAKKVGIYCEKSPSGTGLRLFVKGSIPGHKGRRSGGVELYADSAFLTVTGCRQWPGEIKEAQWLIDGLLEIIGGTIEALPAPAPAVIAQGGADPALVESLSAWTAENHSRLWEGRWQGKPGDLGGTEYSSQSEADMALVGHLAREAVKRGVVAPETLTATVMATFERGGLYRPEKRRQVEQYAVPKAVASALESVKPVMEDAAATDFATAEPGDIIAGRLFARYCQDRLIYAAQAGRWLSWDGTRWVWCSRGEEMAAAKKVAAKVLEHAGKLYAQDPERNKRRMAFAMRLQNLSRLEAMIELAKSEPGMTVGHMTELDAGPWLLGVRNGVVNLKDGTLLQAAPEMLMTRQVQAEYHRGAQCPRWLEFLDQVFDGDGETVAFIQRALGYTLTGVTTEEVLFICYGFGANGKSVFANVISQILADYGQMAPPSLLTVRRDGDAGPRNDLARLSGARLLQINELNQGDRLDEQVVKMLAGREMLSARFLHREFFDFWPTAKGWLRTNHRPVITGEDDGIWRRIMLIPFKRKFAEHERDPWLESKLLEERDGILAWMVEGCLQWQRDGLKPSPLIRRESAGYRKESDLLGEFLDERTESYPDGRVDQGELYGKYRGWCESGGVRAGSKASFSRKLSERGFMESRSNGKRFYTGLRLRG